MPRTSRQKKPNRAARTLNIYCISLRALWLTESHSACRVIPNSDEMSHLGSGNLVNFIFLVAVPGDQYCVTIFTRPILEPSRRTRRVELTGSFRAAGEKLVRAPLVGRGGSRWWPSYSYGVAERLKTPRVTEANSGASRGLTWSGHGPALSGQASLYSTILRPSLAFLAKQYPVTAWHLVKTRKSS